MVYTTNKFGATMNTRIDASIEMLSALAFLPLAYDERASMVKVVVAAKAPNGVGTSFLSPTKVEQLRTACVRALRRAGDKEGRGGPKSSC